MITSLEAEKALIEMGINPNTAFYEGPQDRLYFSQLLVCYTGVVFVDLLDFYVLFV
jgi:hypothetical protein